MSDKYYVFMVKCNDSQTLVVKYGKDPEKLLEGYKKNMPADIAYYRGIHMDGIVWSEEVEGRRRAMALSNDIKDFTQQKKQQLVKVQLRYLL